MSRHFCCCIPVRVAVFVTSLLAFLFSGALAGLGYFALIKNKEQDSNLSHLTSQEKDTAGIIAGVYTLIALVSLFGFIGSVARKRGLVAIYSIMAMVILVIQAAADGWVIYSLFHHNGVVDCTARENDGTTEDCTSLSNGTKGIIIGFIILELLIQTYIVAVIRRYVRQLDEEQSYNRATGYVNSAFKMGSTNTAYYPHQPLDQGQGLLAPQGHYPYSDPHHSFGP